MKQNLFRIISVVIFVFLSINSFSQPSKNLALRASIDFSPQTLAGCWHYENAGKSYALLGANEGVIIVDVTIPDSPVMVLQVPGIHNLWREIKTVGQYAYITTEGLDSTGVLNGIQIVNLSYLPDSAPSKIYKGDGLIFNELEKAHSITSEGEYIYINGHNILTLGRGVLICNISDPWNPTYVGAVIYDYCHDSYVRGDTLWASEIYSGVFSVYDISDRTNPIFLATQQTPGNFNHNSWLSDDGMTLFTTDERSNEPLGSYDVSDLNNITLLDTYYATYFSNSEVHNVRVLNDFLINPSYGSQLTLVDAERPSNLIEVGNYTTGNGLLWDADPYFSSGIICATEKSPGIFYVFEPTYQRACYLEGLITDSVTGVPIPAATVSLLGTSVSKQSKGTGAYYTGIADPGTYDILVTRAGYEDKQVSGVVLNTGVVTMLDFQLKPSSTDISSISTDGKFSISPNPFKHNLLISSIEKSIERVELLNILGERIRIWPLNANQNSISIDTRDISKGVYMLNIYSGGDLFTKRIVKE